MLSSHLQISAYSSQRHNRRRSLVYGRDCETTVWDMSNLVFRQTAGGGHSSGMLQTRLQINREKHKKKRKIFKRHENVTSNHMINWITWNLCTRTLLQQNFSMNWNSVLIYILQILSKWNVSTYFIDQDINMIWKVCTKKVCVYLYTSNITYTNNGTAL